MLSMGLERPGARDHPSWEADVPPALGCLGLSVAIVLLARLPVAAVLTRLRAVAWFLGIALVIFPLTYPGEKIVIGFVPVSSTGFLVAILMVLRAFAILLLAIPAFGTSRFDVTMKALRRLHFPVPLVQIVLFTYRYLFVYSDQLRRMMIAARARGFHPRADRRTLRVAGNGLGVLLVGSIERTQRIHDSMKCRGFYGTFRTLEEFRTRFADVALCGVLLGAGVLLLLWRSL
jgi:cobalt/nickel transport system permease protein